MEVGWIDRSKTMVDLMCQQLDLLDQASQHHAVAVDSVVAVSEEGQEAVAAVLVALDQEEVVDDLAVTSVGSSMAIMRCKINCSIAALHYWCGLGTHVSQDPPTWLAS